MRLVNRITVLFILLASVVQLHAQSNDTSVFFRYAATFDQLIPSIYYPADGRIPDSASLKMLNHVPKGGTMKKSIQVESGEGRDRMLKDMGTSAYTWDLEGRVIRYREYWPGDTVPHLNVRFNFLIRNHMSDITVSSGNNLDTTTFQYNRSGWVGTWKHHALHVDSSYQINGTRMYDSYGNLIVLTNATYGNLRGSYTFEYDRNKRLIRRCFLSGGSGIILCSDTLVYESVGTGNLVSKVTHKLKVAGMKDWVTLEIKTEYPQLKLPISYSDYNDADTNYFYRNLPSYNIHYEYDGSSKLLSESFGNDIMPDMIVANYYYGKYSVPDSIVYTERFLIKKVSVKRVYSRDVRSYDTAGRLTGRTVTTYLHDEMKKGDKEVPTEVVRVNYQW